MPRVRITTVDSDYEADFEFHAVTSISRKGTNSIASYPVESGVNVTDNVAKSNLVITVDGVFTDKALDIDDSLSLTPLQAFDTLFVLQTEAIKLTLTGYDRAHDNLYIKDMDLVKSDNTLQVRLTLEQVRVTEVQFVLLPEIAESDKDKAANKKNGTQTFQEFLEEDNERLRAKISRQVS